MQATKRVSYQNVEIGGHSPKNVCRLIPNLFQDFE
jgi:hypothetical protein